MIRHLVEPDTINNIHIIFVRFVIPPPAPGQTTITHAHHRITHADNTIYLSRPHAMIHHLTHTNGHFYHLTIHPQEDATALEQGRGRRLTTIRGEGQINHNIHSDNNDHDITHRVDDDNEVHINIRFIENEEPQQPGAPTTPNNNANNTHTPARADAPPPQHETPTPQPTTDRIPPTTQRQPHRVEGEGNGNDLESEEDEPGTPSRPSTRQQEQAAPQEATTRQMASVPKKHAPPQPTRITTQGQAAAQWPGTTAKNTNPLIPKFSTKPAPPGPLQPTTVQGYSPFGPQRNNPSPFGAAARTAPASVGDTAPANSHGGQSPHNSQLLARGNTDPDAGGPHDTSSSTSNNQNGTGLQRKRQTLLQRPSRRRAEPG